MTGDLEVPRIGVGKDPFTVKTGGIGIESGRGGFERVANEAQGQDRKSTQLTAAYEALLNSYNALTKE